MLASISPLGERARGNRWGLTVTAYTIASVGSAAAVGAVLGAIGIRAPLALAAVAVLAGIADAIGWRPIGRRQVNEDWLPRYRGWVYGAGFGAQLGVGVATVITTATVVAWMAAALLAGSLVVGLVAGAAFGAARALPFVVVARVHDPSTLRARLARFARSAPAARFGTAAAAIALGVATGVRP